MLGRTYPGQICSAASTLELVGERWSLLILRDAFFKGHRRFTEFERALGIAPNILTKRLEHFVANGLMEVRIVPGNLREYHLTEKGRALKAVVIALNDWGDTWLHPGPIDYIHRGCGGAAKQIVTCDSCGGEVHLDEVGVRPRKG